MSEVVHLLDDAAQADACIMGTLETWPLSDLLLWINKTDRTAMVRVGIGLEAGVIFVRNGFAFRCEWGGAFGEEALFGLLALDSGTFSLIQRDIPDPQPNILTPTEHLLLQYAVSQDERSLAATA